MGSCFPSPFATPPMVDPCCPPLAPPPHPRRILFARRIPPAPSLWYEAHSLRRAGMAAFPVCYVLGHGHGVERFTLTTLTRRGIPVRRLSCLVYYCLVGCLPPATCRPEQDTPILALPLHRRRRCTRNAFGCAQGNRTINVGRFYC